MAKPEKLVTTKIVVDMVRVYPNKWNPNKMSDYIYEKMKKTIEKKGLFGSIIVREDKDGNFEILDGEHRYKAMKDLGYKEIPVENAGQVSDNEAKFWTIYFNNTKGKDDVVSRANLLKELAENQMQLLPWSDDEIEQQKELVDFDFEEFMNEEDKEDDDKPKHSVLTLTLETDVYKAWLAAVEYGKQRDWPQERTFRFLVTEMLAIVAKKNDEN